MVAVRVARDMNEDSETRLHELIGQGGLGTLATIKRDGRPQLSNVSYVYDRDERTILVSVTDGRAKTKNLRRDPRASFHVTGRDGWTYAVAEGTAELSDVTREPGDAASEELVEVYRKIAGEHPDWQEYRDAMIAEKRLVLRLRVERVYGMPG